jgi:hypothetical protein
MEFVHANGRTYQLEWDDKHDCWELVNYENEFYIPEVYEDDLRGWLADGTLTLSGGPEPVPHENPATLPPVRIEPSDLPVEPAEPEPPKPPHSDWLEYVPGKTVLEPGSWLAWASPKVSYSDRRQITWHTVRQVEEVLNGGRLRVVRHSRDVMRSVSEVSADERGFRDRPAWTIYHPPNGTWL